MTRLATIACSLALLSAGCAAGAPAGDATASVGSALGYTTTQYPIVLIPGLLGFKSLSVGVDYFHALPAALASDGAQVFVVSASQADSPMVRGNEIIPQLDKLRLQTGAAKLNLIGHSLGALDARYIAAVRPDLVASVTSVGGPHLGTPLADAMLALPLDLGADGLQGLADLFKLLSGSSDPNDAKTALEWLRPAGAAAFAALYPAAMPTTPCGSGAPVVGGIQYYSWGGVGTLTNPLDLLDPTWVAATTMIPEPNDGMVGRCSTHLGQVIRDDYPQNHIDEVNMVNGLIGLFGPPPTQIFREHAHRLQTDGL